MRVEMIHQAGAEGSSQGKRLGGQRREEVTYTTFTLQALVTYIQHNELDP